MEKGILKDARYLEVELRNLRSIASYIKPRGGEVPEVHGFDIAGASLPFNGVGGGDHIIYLDFKKRYDLDARIAEATAAGRHDVAANLRGCKHRAGIVLADVCGHHATDAMLAAMLHQSFLLGAIYELDLYGQITKHLFENLNTRFFNSSGVNKFITLIYGEITEEARFRFISAAHPAPLVFSRAHNRFMDASEANYTTCPPLGTMPSRNVIDRNTTHSVLGYKDEYELNEWTLMGAGDILLLYTDGLSDHARDGQLYLPNLLEDHLRALQNCPAVEIVEGIKQELLAFSEPADDISFIVIKRSH
jgi:serine phosphatase RsbU (regulator of sigma subunit)